MVNNMFNYNNIFGSNFDPKAFNYYSNNWFPTKLMSEIPELPKVPLSMLSIKSLYNIKNPAESYYKNSKLFGGKIPSKNINLNDFYSKNSNIINSAVSIGSEAIKAFGPERNLNGTTNTLNGVYDDTSNVLLSSGNPWGMLIGGLMKAGSALTDVTSGLRKATDGMTTVDSILESDFFALTPTGLVNSIFGKNSKTFGANKDNEALLGNYLGHALNRKWALDHSNKRYGYFSSGSRRRDDRKIAKYLGHEDTLSGITKDVQQQNDIVNSMYDYASIQRHNKMHGGPGLMQIGKNGLKLDEKILKIKNRKKDFKPKFNPVAINVIFKRPDRNLDLLFEYASLKNPRFWQRIFESPKYLDFGNGNLESHLMLYTIDSQGNGYIYPRILEDDSGNLKDYDDMAFKRAILKGDYLEMNNSEINLFLDNYKNINPNFFTPIFLKGGSIIKDSKIRTLEELIEYAKQLNPRFIQRLSEEPKGIKFIDDEGNEAEGSHYLEWSTDNEGNAVIYPRIQEMEDGNLKFLLSKDAWIRANGNNNTLVMSPEEAEIFFAKDPEYNTAYKRGWPLFFNSFKQGGSIKDSLNNEIEETSQKNVIPDGALHKNKHHMDNAEDLTKKGIPVVDNDGELQAEIEKEELVMTLELTKTMENLYEQFYSEGLSLKEKDLIAISAGKILVDLILYNTDDRAGLINKIQI